MLSFVSSTALKNVHVYIRLDISLVLPKSGSGPVKPVTEPLKNSAKPDCRLAGSDQSDRWFGRFRPYLEIHILHMQFEAHYTDFLDFLDTFDQDYFESDFALILR